MKILRKIWQRIYHYFNPTQEECKHFMGQYIKRDLTPEEWEEEGRKLAELYRMIDEHFSPDKKEEQETDEKE